MAVAWMLAKWRFPTAFADSNMTKHTSGRRAHPIMMWPK
jgi:hypothetical protein